MDSGIDVPCEGVMRYLDERKTLPKKEAMLEAYSKSSISILISGVILTIAGFIEGLFSNIESVTDIGLFARKRSVNLIFDDFLSSCQLRLFLLVSYTYSSF